MKVMPPRGKGWEMGKGRVEGGDRKRLATINVENTEDNRRAWRECLYTAPGLGKYISGAILFDETLYQSTKDGVPFVKVRG